MIVIDHQPSRVGVSVFGEFTLADYKEFEEVVNFKVKFEGPVDLYFDLSQMADLTIDVAWEEIKFSRAHANDCAGHTDEARDSIGSEIVEFNRVRSLDHGQAWIGAAGDRIGRSARVATPSVSVRFRARSTESATESFLRRTTSVHIGLKAPWFGPIGLRGLHPAIHTSSPDR